MDSHIVFWNIIIGLIAAAAGVGGKIFYDMLRFKPPPRLGLDKQKFEEEYDADLCALRHNDVDKSLASLSNQDASTLSCINHIKTKVHGLEIIATEHHQKLETDDRRILSLDQTTKDMIKEYSEIRKDYSAIRLGIDQLLSR
ncbi:MAG TPA: hypothetical protein VMW53_11455 [archaeon]|nr:hypothetical protein [archaeon]